MSDQEQQQISCRIISKPALHFMEARLPLDLIDHVNAYIDEVRDRADDYGGELVGQIKRNPRSAQLKLDLADRTPSTLAQIITQIGQQYVESFELSANDMWTIHSYAGDYNPMHDHGANTFVGLSSIVYLKVPEAIARLADVEGGGTPDLTHASGACDGFTQFVWGTHGVTDSSLLRPPTQQFIKPEVGKLMVFPNWLLHSVQPFFGEGERRTLSCNMDIVVAR